MFTPIPEVTWPASGFAALQGGTGHDDGARNLIAAADATRPSRSSSSSTSAVVTGCLVRESTICWMQAHTAWGSRSSTSRTKSSGAFGLTLHSASILGGKSFRFLVTMSWAFTLIAAA